MMIMNALYNYFLVKKYHYFLLNVCGKKSLEASYLSVAFGAGVTIESIKLYCFQIIVSFQKVSITSTSVFCFDNSRHLSRNSNFCSYFPFENCGF